MKYLFPITLICIFFLACNSGSNSNDGDNGKCKTKPSAIFSDTMKIVAEHHFEAKDEISTENITLRNGVNIEILQSGCKETRQEFRITRKGDFSKMENTNWISGAFITLGELSESSPALMGLGDFATLIAQNAPDIKLGQPFRPDPSLSITVDKISTSELGTIIIILQAVTPQ